MFIDLFCLNPIIPARVSDIDSSIPEFVHIHCCKQGFQSKSITEWHEVEILIRRFVAISSGSALFAKVSILVCRGEGLSSKSILLVLD